MALITVTVDGFDELIHQLEGYAKDLGRKTTEFLRRLSDYGAEVAQQIFDQSVYGGPNPIPSDVIVGTQQIDDNTWAVIARGEQVCFLEFGTGVWAEPTYKYASSVPIKVYPGSWSEDHGGTYEEWLNNGAMGEYRFNRLPAHALLTMYNSMVDYIPTLAEEVFGK